MEPSRDSAAVIEAADLDYKILRPGWFNHEPSSCLLPDAEGQPFISHDVAPNSLAALITDLAPGPWLRFCLATKPRHRGASCNSTNPTTQQYRPPEPERQKTPRKGVSASR
ncbi:hypothetical protein [Kaistia granuli]|uniref:hypothetical protein n=1 Tax=Kaistia granuli TaxID=363259 RepID=UPI003CCBE042